jgi:hypothetical protein
MKRKDEAVNIGFYRDDTGQSFEVVSVKEVRGERPVHSLTSIGAGSFVGVPFGLWANSLIEDNHADLTTLKDQHLQGVCFEQPILPQDKPLCIGDHFDNGLLAIPFVAAVIATGLVSGAAANLMGHKKIFSQRQETHKIIDEEFSQTDERNSRAIGFKLTPKK